MAENVLKDTAAAPLRVVVCGTTFGRVYLKAIERLGDAFQLVGVLASGSAHSRRLAREYGVPLYREVMDIPEGHVDLACVVVRSTVVGGPGQGIARAFLQRGIAVLQEHPVHHDEVVECLRLARRHGTRYELNAFYPDLAAPRRFIETGQRLLRHSPPGWLDAACSVHVLYPLIAILGQLLGGFRPWNFQVYPPPAGGPFTMVGGAIAGIPLTLRVQNQINPKDPDNHTELLHRLSLGCEAGSLTLTDTHGILLWSPRLHVDRDQEGLLELFADDASRHRQPATSVIGDHAVPDWQTVFQEWWPDSVARAMVRFGYVLRDNISDAGRAQHLLSSCQAWGELGAALGQPQTMNPPRPQCLALEEWLVDGGEGAAAC